MKASKPLVAKVSATKPKIPIGANAITTLTTAETASAKSLKNVLVLGEE